MIWINSFVILPSPDIFVKFVYEAVNTEKNHVTNNDEFTDVLDIAQNTMAE